MPSRSISQYEICSLKKKNCFEVEDVKRIKIRYYLAMLLHNIVINFERSFACLETTEIFASF